LDINVALAWLQNTALAVYLQESEWGFAAVESVHVIALTLVLGTIAIVDLRLLGLPRRNVPITALTADCLRLTWAAFALAAVSGSLMFIANAASYYGNLAFRVKMVLLVLAGLNMLVFELRTFRSVAAWDIGEPAPMAGRIAGALSLLLWLSIVIFGRWVGFTKVPY
jgi:hypothetical protein